MDVGVGKAVVAQHRTSFPITRAKKKRWSPERLTTCRHYRE